MLQNLHNIGVGKLLEGHGDTISGRLVKRTATRQGRNAEILVWIQPEGGVQEPICFKLAPKLANIDLGLQRLIKARHSGGVIYEILGVDGQEQTYERPSREWILNVPKSVTVAAVLLVVTGVLLPVNALLGVQLAIPIMLGLGALHVGVGILLYKTVSKLVAFGAFLLNFLSMSVWIIAFNETGDFSGYGPMVGLILLPLQLLLTLYFLCSMSIYE